MEQRNKNILIGGLLAIVLVMAVGYAAFATQLNISASTEINTTWNVHFDETKTVATASSADVDGVMKVNKASTSALGNPTGKLTYTGTGATALTANIETVLKSPGDYIEYTLTIKNEGSFDATAANPVIEWANSETGEGTTIVPVNGATNGTATHGNIKYTVSKPVYQEGDYTIPAKNGDTVSTATMTVRAEYLPTVQSGAGDDITGNVTATQQKAGIKVTIVYNQA